MPLADVIPFTQELVCLPTVLGHESAAAEACVARMGDLSFDRVEIDRVGNAVGVMNGAASGPTLLFDGHLDTVDVVPADRWSHDPFGGEIHDGRMYGRGTSDMKGAVAAMIYGAAAVDRARLRGRIVVSASVGEEWVEGWALREVLKNYPADYVVIGEATELNLVRAGRGRAEFIVTTHGKPAHASTPDLGVNAVYAMLDAVRAIQALPVPRDAIAGHGVMALTDIISTPYPAHSVIPSACRATIERRLVPGETEEDVLAELRGVCPPETTVETAQMHYTSYTGVEWQQSKWFPAWSTPDDHPLVARAHAGLRAAGFDPHLAAYQFCTNAAYTAGELGLPTIGLGPSTEALAHITDEYIQLDQLTKAVDLYRAVAQSVLS